MTRMTRIFNLEHRVTETQSFYYKKDYLCVFVSEVFE